MHGGVWYGLETSLLKGKEREKGRREGGVS
jgi:hypothetical protein